MVHWVTRTAGWRRLIAWALLALLLLCIVDAVSRAQSTSAEIDRRVQRLEDTHSEARLATIESRLDTIDAVGKGILIIVAAQLVIQGFKRKDGR